MNLEPLAELLVKLGSVAGLLSRSGPWTPSEVGRVRPLLWDPSPEVVRAVAWSLPRMHQSHWISVTEPSGQLSTSHEEQEVPRCLGQAGSGGLNRLVTLCYAPQRTLLLHVRMDAIDFAFNRRLFAADNLLKARDLAQIYPTLCGTRFVLACVDCDVTTEDLWFFDDFLAGPTFYQFRAGS